MANEKTESPAERAEYEREQQRFGDDPNAVDRLKIYGYSRDSKGNWSQQIGDEFYSLDPIADREFIEQLNQQEEKNVRK